MKKIILYSILGSMLVLSSCQYFQKPAMTNEEVAALQAENDSLRQELKKNSEEHSRQLNQIRSSYEQQLSQLQKQIQEGTASEKDVYYVVVGSFKNMNYAKGYADKIKTMGYEGKIVDGPNEFNLVTSGTFKTLNASISAMNEARSKIASKSWVYFND